MRPGRPHELKVEEWNWTLEHGDEDDYQTHEHEPSGMRSPGPRDGHWGMTGQLWQQPWTIQIAIDFYRKKGFRQFGQIKVGSTSKI